MLRLHDALPGLLVLFLMTGCGLVDGDTDPVDLTATWHGETERQELTVTFELMLTQLSQTEVTGSGTISQNGDEGSFAVVNSSYLHPSISMQWQFEDRPPMTFSGDVSDNLEQIDGALTGAGFGGEDLTLHRQ